MGASKFSMGCKKAVELLRSAAEGGSSEAMHTLGVAYQQGGLGFSVDIAEAERWFQMAAEKKVPGSIAHRGNCSTAFLCCCMISFQAVCFIEAFAKLATALKLVAAWG